MSLLPFVRSCKSMGWIFPILFLTLVSCNVSNNDQEAEPLGFDKMQNQYYKYGGWTDSSQLDIQPSGEAVAKVLAHSNRKVLEQNVIMLTDVQKEKLAQTSAFFPNFDRDYQPEKQVTDQNRYTFILTYEGSSDTVSVYHPLNAFDNKFNTANCRG